MKKQQRILLAFLVIILILTAVIYSTNKKASESSKKSSAAEKLNPYLFPDPLQRSDWRAFENAKTGLSLIAQNLPSKYGYMEGLNRYIVNDSVWLETLTVARVGEGNPSQHIIARKSTDKGNTWGEWFDVEPEGPPVNSYGKFFRHPVTGQVYIMYLKGPEKDMPELAKAPRHHVGKFVFRYVDEKGNFSPAHKFNLPVSEIDRSTVFNGKYLVIYNAPVPNIISGNDAIGWTTKHGPRTSTGNGESFFVRYVNYLKNDRLEDLEIKLFPEGQGITHPKYNNAADFGPFILNDSLWIFTWRTTFGVIGLTRSKDKGKNWDTDILRYSPSGRRVKNPQGPYSFSTGPDGKGFLAFYNNSAGGIGNYSGRDLVYISYYENRNGEIYVTEPELFQYRIDQLGYKSVERLNPPRFSGEQTEGRILASVSDKKEIRSFTIPSDFIEILSSQFQINKVPELALIYYKDSVRKRIKSPLLPALNNGGGFTISFQLSVGSLNQSNSIIYGMQNGKGLKVELLPDSSVLFTMSDGKDTVNLSSNRGILTPGKTHHVAIIVDGFPALISMVIDEEFQDGGDTKERGTVFFSHNFTDCNGPRSWEVKPDLIKNLRVYNRTLLTTEVIGLQRAESKNIR